MHIFIPVVPYLHLHLGDRFGRDLDVSFKVGQKHIFVLVLFFCTFILSGLYLIWGFVREGAVDARVMQLVPLFSPSFTADLF